MLEILLSDAFRAWDLGFPGWGLEISAFDSGDSVLGRQDLIAGGTVVVSEFLYAFLLCGVLQRYMPYSSCGGLALGFSRDPKILAHP